MQSGITRPLILGLLLVAAAPVRAESFEYRVKHDHALGSCQGKLIVNDHAIDYEASNGKHSQRWPYLEVQRLDVSATRVSLETYQSRGWEKLKKDKTFEFRLLEGQFTAETQEFLRSKLSRPMVARLIGTKGSDAGVLSVRHRHRLGGCQGELRVEEDRLLYSTDLARDNRAWTFDQIETLGSSDPYHLRITTYNETFTFELKKPLEEKTYGFLWAKVNRLEAAPLARHKVGQGSCR
jgi:hypothetical protein